MRFAVAALLGVLLLPAVLRAQDEEPVVTPPRLRDFVEAEYPAEAREEGVEATVVLEITIDAEGAVTDVTVVTPVGRGFDEAALAAARRFVFEPATRDGAPMAARIRYRYVFELREAPPERPPDEVPDVPPPPAPGRIEGRVVDADGGEAVAEAEVILVASDGSLTRRAVTSPDGAFRFDDLPPGGYAVRILAEDYADVIADETVRAGEVTDLTYRVSLIPDTEAFGAVAVIDPPPREVTRRTIRREELTRIPGTRGDALRSVEILPGVARPSFGAGDLIVRGSSPGDSEVLFEGAPVPLLYHFGGLTSFMNSRLLERIDFYPGNFSARYGRKIGGILEVGARDPATDGFHGVVETSFIDVSALVEAPIGERFSFAVGARRSVIDLLIESVIPDDAGIDLVTAPVYEDYQLITSWRPTERDRFRAMLYGSRDRLRIFLSEAFEDDPAIRGDASLRAQFHYGQLSWDRQITDDLEQDLDLQIGPVRGEFGLGDLFSFEGRFIQMVGRAEWRARLNDRVRLIGGLDLQLTPFSLDFRGPPPRQTEGSGNDQPLAREDIVFLSLTDTVWRPGVYLESDLRPVDALQIVLGLRLDYFHEIREWAFDPRLTARVALTDDWAIKLGAGLYSQPPEFQESAIDVGNPDLEPLHSMHFGAGVEHDLTDEIRVSVEGFYKRLWDRVIGVEDGTAPYFVNGGVGNIYGMEVSGRIEPTARFFGFLSYTLSRSERRDRPGEDFRPFDFDQTHIFNLAGVYRLPRNWEVGATVRIVTGNPFTPITGSIYDANNDVYLPLSAGTNSARNPVFHRLDVRVEKKWVFESWRLALFLDIQNVYNQQNREGLIYSFDYAENVELTGLPIIPALGLRGEM